MKHSFAVLGLALVLATAFTADLARAQSTGFAVTQRGADWRVLQKTTIEHGTNRVHRYTELATGMNYTNSYGQWTEASEQITLLPTGGAAATQGRHKVYFPADIYNGVLEVVTPDGKHLKSRPLGVAYDDGSNSVFIATLKHSQGWLTSSNMVTYRDAFTGFKADLVCTYRRGGFECDLVFRQQPPTPDQYGLDNSSSTLQLVTEFFNTADPQEIPAQADDWFGLQDNTLKFGSLTMTHGKAFAVKSSITNSNSQLLSPNSQISVYKSWVHLQGRTFLIEEVPLVYMADDLDALPLTASTNPKTPDASTKTLLASRHREFPPSQGFVSDTNQILIASADLNKQPGVVLDYNTVDSDQTDFTFVSGTTYFITGDYNLNGTTTFEPGTVLKFGNMGNGLQCNGDIICPAEASDPALFTSMNDDSVGAVVDGSNGNPSVGGNFITLNASVSPLKNLRMSYANTFIIEYNDSPLEISDSQFFHCDYNNALDFINNQTQLTLNNVLFSQCAAISYNDGSGDGGYVNGNHVTVDRSVCGASLGGEGCVAYFVNSLLTEVGFTDNITLDHSFILGSNEGIYQAAGDAHYYLAASSPYRNVGTTDINPDLLAEIQTMTTYAPQDGSYPDTDQPDLGYHYPVNEDSDHDSLPDWWEWKYFGDYSQSGNTLDSFGTTLLFDYQNGLDPFAADSDSDGLPDRWECNYFGNLNHSGSELDGFGNSLLFYYNNGFNPNTVVLFSLQFPSEVNTNIVNGTVAVIGGTPFYMAILVNDTNNADAIWQPYTGSNVVVSLNSGEGLYTVRMGLRGLPGDAEQTWQQTEVMFSVPVALTIAITNPTSATVSTPMIQLQGFVNKTLGALTYDVSNAVGVITNQQGYWQAAFYDTNLLQFTTNFFQFYDIALTNGLNIITLHAADLGGNTATTNFSVTLDYSTDTTPPALNLIWPQNGMKISGGNFTVQAQMDDATATVTASMNGGTNAVQGLIERSGLVWVNNLPLAAGTNTLTITATDAAGNSTTTNLTLVQSVVLVTMDPLSSDQLNQSTVWVTGTCSDTNSTYCIYVNGVQAYYWDDAGDWEADNVPVSATGTATFDVEVYVGDPVNVGSQIISLAQPATISLMSYARHVHWSSDQNCGASHGSEKVNWLYQSGGVDFGSGGGVDGDCQSYHSSHATSLAGGYNGYSPQWEIKNTTKHDGFSPYWVYIYYWDDWVYVPNYFVSVWNDDVHARVMVVPSGQAAIGQTALYLVQAQVLNEDTGLQLVAGAVQFLNQMAGTTTEDVTNSDGSVWSQGLVSAPAGAQVEVTPQAAGNYSFTGMKLSKLVWFSVDTSGEPGNFHASDVASALQSQLAANVFDGLPAGQGVQIMVNEEATLSKKLGWDSSAKQTYVNRVTWDLGGGICAARGKPSQGKIQINPGKIEELDAQFGRNISAQTWVNIFAHEGIWGNAGGNSDCNPLNPFSTCETGEISAGTLGVPAYLYDPYFVLLSSRTTLRSKFGF